MTRIKRNFVVLLLFALGTPMLASAQDMPAPPSPEGLEFFETNVRPIFAEHCIACHGPEKQKNGLRLDTRDDFLKGGEHGPIVQAGNPGVSALVHALRQDGEIKMPPAGKLDDALIQAIEQWIALGAPWPEGGAAPIKPKSMDARIADAKAHHWAFQPVQSPTPPAVQHADRVANPVDAFIEAKLEASGLTMSAPADKRALLRRVYYDLVGLPPSDAQVEAFVADIAPDAYAKVVEELLASPRYGERWGRYWLDLARYSDTKGYVFQEERTYPFSYTYRDYVIRAFNEDLPFDQFIRQQLAADRMELGEDKRPLAGLGLLTLGRRFINNIHDITDDRIDVVTRGFMGLTMTCARCHDHKYDPLPAADYYSLYGVFRSASEPAELPVIQERAADDPQYIDYKNTLAARQKDLDDFLMEKHIEVLAHAREKIGDYLQAACDTLEKDDEALRALAKERNLRWPLVQRWRDYLKPKLAAQPPDPIWGPLAAFRALPAEGFEAGAGDLAKKIAENKDAAAPVNAKLAAEFKGDPPKDVGGVFERYRKALAAADAAWKEHLAASTQIALKNNAAPTLPTALNDTAQEQLRLVLFAAESPANVPAADLPTVGDVALRNETSAKKNRILETIASHPGRPDCAQVVNDLDKPFEPYVFLRGKPENRGDSVPRQFLAVLSGPERKPFTSGSGRLELADAIASKDNPLTARVFVNRVWLQHFGRALVATPSDFGLRSEPPTHPELLDFLARSFMDNNWSVKSLQRLILLSNAYQQASVERDDGRSADPENRLLWRQNRRRLDFEALRDSLLAASGGIDLTTGGPSVQITDTPFTKRRTVYSFIDRQNLPGVFRTFDYASPDAHSPRRYQTTVPQQALFMMNSPFVVEQARALAARPELTPTGEPGGEVRKLYEVVFQRDPDADEFALGERFLGQAKAEPPQSPAWQYGYAAFDPATAHITAFTPFPYFGDGAWKGGKAVPDATIGWSQLTSGGGHPGHDNNFTVVRRWVAPMDGKININAELSHGGECGDGVDGYILPAAGAPLWHEHVKYSKAQAALVDIEVHTGDTIDFLLSPGGDENCDSFGFAPHIKYTGLASGTSQRTEWNAITDFAGPMPPPLQPLEQYAQVLLLSNEFAFVD